MAKPGVSSFTPETREKIVNALRAGNYRVAACKFAGISDETFRRWFNAGKRGEPEYVDFVEQVTQAEAKAEAAGYDWLDGWVWDRWGWG